MSDLSSVLTWKHPTTEWTVSDNVVVEFAGGVPSAETLATWTAEYEAHLTATKYQRDRAAEYPEIVDQLDKIYHEGIDGWKDEIKAVKDKYPKP